MNFFHKVIYRLGFPQNYWHHIKLLLPLVISLVLQRLYHIVDNRFVNELGNEALLIHNVQYNFIVLGYFLGSATAMSSLVFWCRAECVGKQGSIFRKHIFVTLLVSIFFAFLFVLLLPHMITHFGIASEHMRLAKIYISIGLINMVLQSVYGGLDGMMIATGQQKKCMLYSAVIVCANIVADGTGVYIFITRSAQSAESVWLPLYIIILSTTILNFVAIIFAAKAIHQKVDGWDSYPLREILKVWKSEIAIAIFRAFSPLIYVYQLGMLQGSVGFLVTYNLVLHMAYVFCLPLAAGMQIAMRDATNNLDGANISSRSSWLRILLYTAFLPTFILLCFGMIMPNSLMKVFYNFLPPADHIPFISIFLFGCLIGQIGHMVAIPIRVQKRSNLVTKNILFAEYGVLLGGTHVLITLNVATPATICWITVAFCTTFLALNLNTLKPQLYKKTLLAFQTGDAS